MATMDCARDQFFAGAALAGYQHGGFRGSYLTYERKHLLHGRTGSHQIHQHALIRQLPLQAFRFLG